MTFQEILQTRRKALGYTLKDIANRIGVTEATVQRWESGNIKSLRHPRITKLAEILEVSPAYLMGWGGDINNPPQFSASRLQNFEGSDPEVKQIELAKLDHIDELVSAAGKLSVEQINLLTSMAKNMKDKD